MSWKSCQPTRPFRPAVLAGLLLLAGIPEAAALDPHEAFTVLCSSCHTVGGGDGVGPDLAGVTERRDREWLVRFIRSPREVIAAGDPTALEVYARFGGRVMPDHSFAPHDIHRLLDYIERGGPSAVQAAEPAIDRARVGRLLFYGARRFEKGGAPCSLCHSVRSGTPGRSLGGDLYAISPRYSAAELVSLLGMPTTPIMRGVYASHPLTSEEAASLATYVAGEAAAGRPPAADPVAARTPWLGLLTGCLLGLFVDLTMTARGRRRSGGGEP